DGIRDFHVTGVQTCALPICTGSGALLLAGLSEFPQAQGVGIDASAAALAVAHNNADRLGFSDRSRFLLQDWTAPDWTQFMQQPRSEERRVGKEGEERWTGAA